MISNFALLLSHEGIKLAHRTPDGWAEIGHISLLDDDLTPKLNQLRKQAEALSVTEFSSKIVLPHDQIKYLTLPNVEDDQREDAIKEALERATPYLIDDLVYDWEEGEDGMNVAAVARDTLSEAENFIVQHGFNPISFVAAPDDALFSVEPFFGSCSNAAADQDVTDSIEAEVDKVILTAPTEAPMAEVVDDLAALAPLVDQADSADERDAAPQDPDETTPAPEAEDTPKIAPLVADRDADLSTFSFPTLGPATSTSILGGMKPGIRPAPAMGIAAERDSDVEDRSFPSWAGAAEKNKPFSVDEDIEPAKIGWLARGKKGDVEDSVAPPSWMKTDDSASVEIDAAGFEEESEAAAWIPAAKAAPIKQPLYDELDNEAEKLEIFGNRGERDRPAAAWSPLWIGVIVVLVLLIIGGSFFGLRYFSAPDTPLIVEAEQTPAIVAEPEPEQTAPIGAEAEPEQTALIIAQPEPVEAVPETTPATEDTQIVDTPIAKDETTEAEVDLPPVDATTALGDPVETPGVDDAIDLAATAETAAFDGATALESTLAQPDPERVLETETNTPDAPIEPVLEEFVAAQTDILTEAPNAAEIAPVRPASGDPIQPDEAQPDTDVTVVTEPAEVIVEQADPIVESVVAAEPAEPQPEPQPEIAKPADLLDRAATDWTSLSVEARDARYAATGIWPLAPTAPPAPSGESVGALFLATVDPVVFATDAYAITAEADLLSDKALTAVPNPPALGTRFDRDDRGLVTATPEGAVTPDGITVFQGIPPRVPPLAPRPDPLDQQAAQRAALEGKIPLLRPDIEIAAADTPETPEVAGPTPVASSLPPLRPAAIAALAEQPEVAVNPLALDRTPMPRLRPNNIGEIVYNTERATVAAQTTTAVAPSNNTVAGRATETEAISLRGINLIGIYGETGDRRALVRLQSGRYTKIEVGDRLNGGQVSAIDQDRVLYVRNGQTVVLRMPSN